LSEIDPINGPPASPGWKRPQKEILREIIAILDRNMREAEEDRKRLAIDRKKAGKEGSV